jgi:diguanylate cyclase (GGDEF)-like protein
MDGNQGPGEGEVQAAHGPGPAPGDALPAAVAGRGDETASTYRAFGALARFKLMLVDDDPIMMEMVQVYLEEAGYSGFVTSSDPAQAMKLMRAHRPDLLLLDLMMPGITGFDILGEIRADPDLRYTPVVILTAESDPASKLRALELGATDLLTKPVDPSELRLRVRNVLAFKAYQDRLADCDPLTGLPNRRKFTTGLETALKAHEGGSRGCALLHVDLDRFKQVNDTFGHHVGDKLLCAAAERLQSKVVDSDEGVQLARIAGNSFAVLAPGLHNLTKEDTAASLARRALSAIDEAFEIDGKKLFVTASVGVALSPGDGADATTLLKHAEMAMYQAKQRGRNASAFYSGELNARAHERMTMETQLRQAVAREEFVLYFQPKVDVASSRIVGAEALLRWKHPEQGMVSPSRFVPIAEESGLIGEIGQWVLRAACLEAKAWNRAGYAVNVAVNVSPEQFKQRKVWLAVRAALERSGLKPTQMVLELTESMLMENADQSIEMLNELKEMGVQLAVDDFGAGYSSLAYLSKFPIDELKIDQSFVKGLPGQRQSAAIIGAVVGLARELDLKVVAEGVESSAQLDYLRARGCDQYQGYLCSRPVPPAPFLQLLQRSNSAAA